MNADHMYFVWLDMLNQLLELTWTTAATATWGQGLLAECEANLTGWASRD